MSRNLALLIAVAGFLLAAPAALADPAQPAQGQGNMQGDQASWIADPHIHAYYEMTKEAFAGGATHVDAAAYTQRSEAIFRAFAVSRGMNPDAMVEHLKLIPGQMIQIAKEDPQALATYDTFVAALFGPQ